MPRGMLLGRYIALDELGENVFAAYDPELDRKVAIELLQGGDPEALLREAKAMARLAHPNVLAVHDVGTVDGRVFVAMELVEGVRLREWLRDKRTWREILAVMRGAGAGLAAAHAAGLVHGDFTPGCVLIGADGRVRVTDFASTGDPGADRRAFAAVTYEALYGERPPEGNGVPARIERALKAESSSLDELLAELAYDPAARRRKVAIAAAAAAVVAGGVALGVFASRGAGPQCSGFERKLAGTWDAPLRDKVHAAFTATKRVYAEPSFAGVARALDVYAAKWTAASEESCAATRVRGEQTEDALALRTSCLDQLHDELAALVRVLVEADTAVVDKGDKIVFELEQRDPIERCANVAQLRAAELPPTEPADKVAMLHTKSALANVELAAGHWLAALVAAQAAADLSREVHYVPFEAQALLVRGSALAATGNAPDAIEAFSAATWAALSSKRDDVAVQSALSAALVTSDILGRSGDAKFWLALGTATAKRVGTDRTTEARRLQIEGLVAAQAGEHAHAVEVHEQALAAAIRELGPDDPTLWDPEQMLGVSLTKAGEFARAKPHLEHAIALRERSAGTDHPDVGILLDDIGVCYQHMGESDKARDAYMRALGIRERAVGKTSPLLLATLNNLADYLREAGDAKSALEHIERARQIAVRFPGTGHPMYHFVQTTYAEILGSLGRTAEARTAFDELLALEEKTSSEALPTTLTSRAQLALAEHDYRGALAFADRAIKKLEAAGGPDDASLWKPLIVAGQAKRALGDAAAARAAFTRALAIGERTKVREEDLAPARAGVR
jgi:tetratricopeptide (TPR) repeat protein